MMTHRLSTLIPVFMLLGGLLFTCGCGKAEYERRVLDTLHAQTEKGSLAAAVKLEGTTLDIRLPPSVDQTAKAYTTGSLEPNGTDKVNPARLNPPFLTIPGLRVCYETFIPDPTTKEPVAVYWYLGALAPGEPLPDGKPIEQYAQEKLTAAFAKEQRTPVVESAQLGPVIWMKTTISGNQAFIGPTGASVDTHAVFEMYSGDVGGWRLVVAFRAPTSVLKASRAEELAPQVAASIKVAGAPAPAAAP